MDQRTVVLNGDTYDLIQSRAHDLDVAWTVAGDVVPHGMFGPAVEPRFPGRWRAWFYWPAPDTRDSISAFGDNEAGALLALVAEVKS